MSTALALAASLASAACILDAGAQPKSLGAYTGTIDISETTPGLTYKARVKLTMPVSDRTADAVNAEFLAGEAPNAMVLVSQWETFHKDKAADSGGQFNTKSCKLAAPVEVPMMVSGVLNVDLKKKTHALSVALVGTSQVTFDCVHSRSGASKEKGGFAFALGTGEPGAHYETQLPFTDAGRLAAKHTLKATREHGPIVQEWDLKLAR